MTGSPTQAALARLARAWEAAPRHYRLASGAPPAADEEQARAQLHDMLAASQWLPVPREGLQRALRDAQTVSKHVLYSKGGGSGSQQQHEMVRMYVFERVPATGRGHGFGSRQPRSKRSKELAQVDHSHLHRVLRRVAALMQAFGGSGEQSQARAIANAAAGQGQRVLRVLFLPLAAKRRFPADPAGGELVGPAHVNGGFYAPRTHTVVITRHEEYPKVLLHETLHALLHGGGRFGEASAQLKLALHAHPGTALLLEETYVETWAVLAQVAMTCAELGLAPTEAAKRVRAEARWCAAAVRRLAAAYDWPARPWRERTNAFAYLFLRCALMQQPQTLDAFVSQQRPAAAAAALERLLLSGAGAQGIAKPGAAPALRRPGQQGSQPRHPVQVQARRPSSLRMTRYGCL